MCLSSQCLFRPLGNPGLGKSNQGRLDDENRVSRLIDNQTDPEYEKEI